MENKPVGLNFPLDFPQCPNCGSKRRVADEVMKELKAAGRAKQEDSSAIVIWQTIVANPHFALFSVPVIISLIDICADCGTVRCFHVEKGQRTPKMPQNAISPQ